MLRTVSPHAARAVGLVASVLLVASCDGLLGIEEIEFSPDGGADASLGGAGGRATADGSVADGPPPDAPLPSVIEAPGCAPDHRCSSPEVSCCESRLVPGGTFQQGCEWSKTTPCVDSWGPEHPATVDSFYLDTFEVTGKRWELFVEDYNLWRADGNPKPGAGAHPRVATSGWRADWDAYLPKNEAFVEYPLNCSSGDQGQFYTYDAFNDPKLPINCVTWQLSFAFASGTEGACRPRRSGSTRRPVARRIVSIHGAMKRRPQIGPATTRQT